jgi:predicted GNAT family acetyltransferase
MSDDDATIEVVDVPEKSRFEIRVDGELAGFADYSRMGDRVIFRHTEIHDAYEGRGLGSKLAQGALDAARTAGHGVVPLCPFIASYIERHPDYQDLVDQECLDYLARPRRRS